LGLNHFELKRTDENEHKVQSTAKIINKLNNDTLLIRIDNYVRTWLDKDDMKDIIFFLILQSRKLHQKNRTCR
jgi:hypothetical protein